MRSRKRNQNGKKKISDFSIPGFKRVRKCSVDLSDPIYFFNLFFTEYFVKFIAGESNEIAKRKNQKRDKKIELISDKESKFFFGITIYMGLKNIPNLDYYFDKKSIFFDEIISSSITRLRYQEINSVLTCLGEDDFKNGKIKNSFYMQEYLTFHFQKMYSPGKNIAIDESMIPYKGRLKNKVYAPNKPDKFGMKLYSLAESETSYLLNFSIFSTTNTIINTCKFLIKNYESKNHHLYIDNFYNSFYLCTEMRKSEYMFVVPLEIVEGGL